MHARKPSRQLGFTLVELITVVILVGILAALGGMLIATPVQSFVDTSRRAELVDIADNALQRISREVRNAVPNSVRVTSSGSRTALEFLNAAAGGRYRARRDTGGAGDPLRRVSPDTFDALGGVTGTVNPGPAGQANCLSGNSDCLVVYNTGTGPGDYNAYDGDNIAAITAAGGGQITFDNGPGWTFPFPIPPSASQRFYVVDGPVSYVCDLSTGEIRRYEGYGIGATQPVAAADFPPGSGALLAGQVQGCTFSYTAGPSARQGLVTLRVTLTDAPTGESVALLYQVHVVNMP